jgi:hypothetical protein
VRTRQRFGVRSVHPQRQLATVCAMGGLSRFAHAYYVGNLLVIASYALLRNRLAEPAAVEGPHARLPTYERQAALMLLCSFGLKARARAAAARALPSTTCRACVQSLAAWCPCRAHTRTQPLSRAATPFRASPRALTRAARWLVR